MGAWRRSGEFAAWWKGGDGGRATQEVGGGEGFGAGWTREIWRFLWLGISIQARGAIS